MSHVLNRGIWVPVSSLQTTGTPDGTKFLRDDGAWASVGGGTGDVTGQSSSVDSEVALFSGTGGKTIKRATGSGLLKLTSGVASVATAGTDYYNPGGTDVAIVDGGTGVSTLPSGLLKGAGTGAITAAVAGTDYLTPSGSAASLTSFPTLNQNTTGSAAKWTTARNVDGQSLDGTADITVIAPGTHAATGKTTPVDADELPLVDSAASNVLKKLTWANLKATLKTYLDTLYVSISGALGTPSSGTLTNCTGLPVSGITASTATALGVGTLELGNASDTTLSRSAGGQLAVEGVDVITTSNTKAMTNKTLTNPTITNYTETQFAIGNSSTAKTIDLANGTIQTMTLTNNCTVTMPTAGGKSFTLITDSGAGSFTCAFTGVKWAGGVAGVASTAASKKDVWTFSDDGTSWYGSVAKAFA